jgi:hypothetical protein
LEEIKATYHLQLFSGVSHGFGTRGDPEVENSRISFLKISTRTIIIDCLILGWAKEKSAQGIIEWFLRFNTG